MDYLRQRKKYLLSTSSARMDKLDSSFRSVSSDADLSGNVDCNSSSFDEQNETKNHINSNDEKLQEDNSIVHKDNLDDDELSTMEALRLLDDAFGYPYLLKQSDDKPSKKTKPKKFRNNAPSTSDNLSNKNIDLDSSNSTKQRSSKKPDLNDIQVENKAYASKTTISVPSSISYNSNIQQQIASNNKDINNKIVKDDVINYLLSSPINKSFLEENSNGESTVNTDDTTRSIKRRYGGRFYLTKKILPDLKINGSKKTETNKKVEVLPVRPKTPVKEVQKKIVGENKDCIFNKIEKKNKEILVHSVLSKTVLSSQIVTKDNRENMIINKTVKDCKENAADEQTLQITQANKSNIKNNVLDLKKNRFIPHVELNNSASINDSKQGSGTKYSVTRKNETSKSTKPKALKQEPNATKLQAMRSSINVSLDIKKKSLISNESLNNSTSVSDSLKRSFIKPSLPPQKYETKTVLKPKVSVQEQVPQVMKSNINNVAYLRKTRLIPPITLNNTACIKESKKNSDTQSVIKRKDSNNPILKPKSSIPTFEPNNKNPKQTVSFESKNKSSTNVVQKKTLHYPHAQKVMDFPNKSQMFLQRVEKQDPSTKKSSNINNIWSSRNNRTSSTTLASTNLKKDVLSLTEKGKVPTIKNNSQVSTENVKKSESSKLRKATSFKSISLSKSTYLLTKVKEDTKDSSFQKRKDYYSGLKLNMGKSKL